MLRSNVLFPPQLSHHQNFSLQFARDTYEIIIDIVDIDDTKLWQQVKNYGDNRQLQNDLHSAISNQQ